jgi:hypothetical protein
MKALINIVIGLLLCTSARAQIQPFPNPGDWFPRTSRDDTTFFTALLYNAQGEWPVSVTNIEVTHPSAYQVFWSVENLFGSNL